MHGIGMSLRKDKVTVSQMLQSRWLLFLGVDANTGAEVHLEGVEAGVMSAVMSHANLKEAFAQWLGYAEPVVEQVMTTLYDHDDVIFADCCYEKPKEEGVQQVKFELQSVLSLIVDLSLMAEDKGAKLHVISCGALMMGLVANAKANHGVIDPEACGCNDFFYSGEAAHVLGTDVYNLLFVHAGGERIAEAIIATRYHWGRPDQGANTAYTNCAKAAFLERAIFGVVDPEHASTQLKVKLPQSYTDAFVVEEFPAFDAWDTQDDPFNPGPTNYFRLSAAQLRVCRRCSRGERRAPAPTTATRRESSSSQSRCSATPTRRGCAGRAVAGTPSPPTASTATS